MSWRCEPLPLPGLLRLEHPGVGDARGELRELFRASGLAALPPAACFVQDNVTHSRGGVLRGLHYQLPPRAQGKLVAVLEGEIFDVAVDIRRGSPSFGHWHGEWLSRGNGRLLFIPPGFAHGFCVPGKQATVFYKLTAEYAPDGERGIRWDDPALGITWPLAQPLLSEKDARLPLLAEAEPGA